MANYRKTLVSAPLFRPQPFPDTAMWMLQTARYHGIEVSVLGEGRPWTSFYECKIRHLWEAVKGLVGYDYILFIDGDDSLFATGLGEIHSQFERINKPFVISGELMCWPWPKRYAASTPNKQQRFRHLNSGGYMATWDSFLQVLRTVMDLSDDGYQEEFQGQVLSIKTRDQAAYYRAWMEGLPLTIDYDCRIFQVLMGFDPRWLNQEFQWGRRPLNLTTNTTPCIFHANGAMRWMMAGLRNMLLR